MENLEVFVALLICTILLAVFSERVKVPYPIVLISVGVFISLVPWLPNVQLDPDIVLLLFLPPLLYSAAWFMPWNDFRKSLRPITLLAFGYIIFSTAAVAWVAVSIIPGFTWPLGFLLGAILAPPDAVAAVSILRDKPLPRRVKTILEGESLVNDSSALIAYRFAIAAVVSGTFSLPVAAGQFFLVAGGGVAIGFIIAYVVYKLHRYINNSPVVDTSMTLATPYFSYLLAEHFHLSGVLAVVTTGLWLSRKSSILFSHATRIQAVATWRTLVFLLEGIIFLLIGLQINQIVSHFSNQQLVVMTLAGLVISVSVVVFRLIWIFPGAYVPRMLSKRIREREPDTNWRAVFFIGWTAIRGVVSLAAALALPLTLPNGEPFPFREEILFITFCVIVYTLFVNGSALPWLIRWLKLKPAAADQEHEQAIRLRLANASIEHIEENYALNALAESVLALIKSKYEVRLAQLYRAQQQAEGAASPASLSTWLNEDVLTQFHHIQREMIRFERQLLLDLRSQDQIQDEAFRRIETELDLEESRLGLDMGEGGGGH